MFVISRGFNVQIRMGDIRDRFGSFIAYRAPELSHLRHATLFMFFYMFAILRRIIAGLHLYVWLHVCSCLVVPNS